MADAALDGEFAEAVELRTLGGREPIPVVARDERTFLHAEVDGVVVHHETVARVPAEVAVRTRVGVAVLQLCGHVEEHVQLLQSYVRAQDVVGSREEAHARKRAVAPLGLSHKAAERSVGAGAHGIWRWPRSGQRDGKREDGRD